MPLYLTAAHSSRVSKPTAKSSTSRPRPSSSAGPASSPRKKPSSQRTQTRTTTRPDDEEDHGDGHSADEERLVPTGKVLSSVPNVSGPGVLAAIHHAHDSMFAAIPERAGMNSVRIADVLNFRRNLPAVVTLAHVHALVAAASKAEREIAALQATGRVRKIQVTGRGNDISGTGEVLITLDALRTLLARSDLPADIASDFEQLLRRQPRATAFAPRELPVAHVKALTRTGFLVSASLAGSRNVALAGSALVGMPKISRAASGTAAAIGGDAAFENLGGVGAAPRPASSVSVHAPGDGAAGRLALSVPNIGPYLRLVTAARTHLLDLLRRAKYREGPLFLVRERWDGSVDPDSHVSAAKRLRGEFVGVLPAKTKRWKDLYGLNFDWVVDECLGAGLVELFETRSVGLGIRALT